MRMSDTATMIVKDHWWVGERACEWRSWLWTCSAKGLLSAGSLRSGDQAGGFRFAGEMNSQDLVDDAAPDPGDRHAVKEYRGASTSWPSLNPGSHFCVSVQQNCTITWSVCLYTGCKLTCILAWSALKSVSHVEWSLVWLKEMGMALIVPRDDDDQQTTQRQFSMRCASGTHFATCGRLRRLGPQAAIRSA